MNRSLLMVLALTAALPLSACNNKGKPHNRNRSTSAELHGGLNGGNPIGGGTGQGQALTAITPNVGSPFGGDAVTLTGSGFVAGSTVEFDGAAATDVVVASATSITCKTPSHAPGLVDVVVVLPTNQTLRLNNAFTFDPNVGPLARVADYGDPTAEEQELIELMQRGRRDPVAEAQRINAKYGTSLDFSSFQPRQPVSHNGFLEAAADGHADDMATRGFYGHVNPDGVNANGRVIASTYDLNDYFGTNATINLTENIGKGTGSAPGNLLTTPQSVHDTFIIDAGVMGAKHRVMILGQGQFSKYRENGMGYLHRAPSDYIVEEFAYTKRDKPFLLGVAFNDNDGDGIARVGEGQPGATVTLSHASGFSISTQTKTAGGFSFEVFVPGTYTLTIDGRSTQVTIGTDNVKVDLRSGAIQTY